LKDKEYAEILEEDEGEDREEVKHQESLSSISTTGSHHTAHSGLPRNDTSLEDSGIQAYVT
jgi:hypothetical protein